VLSSIFKSKPKTPIQLGAIAFLNTMPIYWPWRIPGAGARVKNSAIELHEAVPAELNRLVNENKLPISPVSSAFYLRNQNKLILLDDLSVSSPGAVESVLFVANRNWGTELLDYKTIAVPTDSETSVALLAHLLKQATGQDCQNRFQFYDPKDASRVLEQHGNALIIGDNALLAKEAGFDEVFQLNDLSSLWQAETGLPFVFAVWVAQKDWAEKHPNELKQVNHLLCDNRDFFFQTPILFCDGLLVGTRQSQISEEVLRHYYMHCLTYNLTPHHAKALEQFGMILSELDAASQKNKDVSADTFAVAGHIL
jgi:chorismate dehydratase